MPVDKTKLNSEYNKLLGRIKFRVFTALAMPTARFAGVKIIQLDDISCAATLPGGWRSQNPFKTMYWAVQGMGAELSTGAAPFAISKSMPEKIRMFVVGVESKFTKAAKGKITFTSNDNSISRAAIEESMASGKPVDCNLSAIGTNLSGEVVSEWVFKWTFLVIKKGIIK